MENTSRTVGNDFWQRNFKLAFDFLKTVMECFSNFSNILSIFWNNIAQTLLIIIFYYIINVSVVNTIFIYPKESFI